MNGRTSLTLSDGKPAYVYNYFGPESDTIASPDAIEGSTVEIKLQFDYDYDTDGTGNGGLATLFVDSKRSPRMWTDPSQWFDRIF